jgi:hypothetical protein
MPQDQWLTSNDFGQQFAYGQRWFQREGTTNDQNIVTQAWNNTHALPSGTESCIGCNT